MLGIFLVACLILPMLTPDLEMWLESEKSYMSRCQRR